MTDYNDGNWYGWNGGECPVHPATVVDALFGDGGKQLSIAGDHLDWSGPDRLPLSYVAAFRVVKAYREPREWWVVMAGRLSIANCDTPDEAEKRAANYVDGHVVHVGELLK